MSPLRGVEHHVGLFAAAAPAEGEPAWLGAIRKRAIERFAELGFPTTRLEEWKHTNVAQIARTPFVPAPAPRRFPGPADLMHLDPVDEASARLVFVDGFFAPELSATGGLPEGIEVTTLGAGLGRQDAALETHLAQQASVDSHAFVALNTAFFRDGAFLRVGPGVDLHGPIHVVFLTAGEGSATAVHPRVCVWVGAGSRAQLVESYLSLGRGTCLTNAVTEVRLEANAALDHVSWRDETHSTYHLSCLELRQARDSRYTSHAISAGAALTRNDLRARLEGEGAECRLLGLFAATDRQHVDNHTTVDHVEPRCTSFELYKGILGDRARGVFNGRIIVRPDAQKTDARQSNPNLLISEGAEIDTMPQLEIHADDVKCSHGSSIGHLDEDSLFYLRTRGIPRELARTMLMRGFAAEITQEIYSVGLRARVEQVLQQRFRHEEAA